MLQESITQASSMISPAAQMFTMMRKLQLTRPELAARARENWLYVNQTNIFGASAAERADIIARSNFWLTIWSEATRYVR